MLFGRNKKNPIKLPGNKDSQVEKWVYTTCGYCSTGCSIEVWVNKEGKGVTSRGVGGADVNRGKLCLKGIFEHELFDSSNRGDKPLMRSKIFDQYEQVSWDEAFDKTASEIKRIQQTYGRDSFSIVSTGQILTEEFYTLGKLARGVIGTNNYANAQVCRSNCRHVFLGIPRVILKASALVQI